MTYGNCRTFNAFSKLINLAAIDIADLEAEAVRCEVNLWPVMHSWTLTAAAASRRTLDSMATAAERQAARSGQVEANFATEKGIEAKRDKRAADAKRREEEKRKEAEGAVANTAAPSTVEGAAIAAVGPGPSTNAAVAVPTVVAKKARSNASLPEGRSGFVNRPAAPMGESQPVGQPATTQAGCTDVGVAPAPDAVRGAPRSLRKVQLGPSGAKRKTADGEQTPATSTSLLGKPNDTGPAGTKKSTARGVLSSPEKRTSRCRRLSFTSGPSPVPPKPPPVTDMEVDGEVREERSRKKRKKGKKR